MADSTSTALPQPARPLPTSASDGAALRGEALVIWVIWMTYGSFYFCRQNISAAVPGLQSEGLTRTEIGWILGALKVAYAFGQLVNGQLAERFSARWLLAAGMLGSAALNVIFGLSEGLYFLLFIWACNGYCQALGWTPCIRVAANWIPVGRRGRAIGIIGTSYQLMAGVTFLVAGWSAYWLGWRGAMYVPAILLAAAAVHMLLFLRETPHGGHGDWCANPEAANNRMLAGATPSSQDGQFGIAAGAPLAGAIQSEIADTTPSAHRRHAIAAGQPPQDDNKRPAPARDIRNSITDNILATVTNPFLWVLAIGLALLDACRYGFQDWGLAHLNEVQQQHVGITAAKYALLPAGGILGALFAGWATDRHFGGRRAPVICLLLVLLGVLTLSYDVVTRTSEWGTIPLLFALGFAIFGPQVLLVGTAPTDLARQGAAAAAAGFVNFMGYLGAFSGDLVTGYLAQHYDWRTAIYFWAACAFAAAAVVAVLWRVGVKRE